MATRGRDRANGEVVHRSPQFEEDRFLVDLDLTASARDRSAPLLEPEEEIYRAVQLGLGDYVRKNGFQQVVIGLVGRHRLGADSGHRRRCPRTRCGVGCRCRRGSPRSIPKPMPRIWRNVWGSASNGPDRVGLPGYLDTLRPALRGHRAGVAEENLQARIRGALLMAISNKFGPMVVATGNKSEMAAGYATIYGDMVGGYSVLKDVFKTTVYKLAAWRNPDFEVIPESTIDKPPSAELRPNQKDSDSLPPYDQLDPILRLYIEEDAGWRKSSPPATTPR